MRRCRDGAIRLAEGALIKIVESKETSRTSSQLVCDGTGVFKDGDDTATRYRAYRDEDGEVMIAWDTDEAQKRASDALTAEAEREAEAFVEDMQREVRETM